MSPLVVLASAGLVAAAAPDGLLGQAADLAGSAYHYRADLAPEQNPPEAWVLLMQYAGLPFDRPVDQTAPAIRQALCGLLWEEVRPVRRVDLVWPARGRRPAPEDLSLLYLDATDGQAHTWWNPRTAKPAEEPRITPDGRSWSFAIPVDTWGVVAAVAGETPAASFAVPEVRAYGPDTWKKLELEIEWGWEPERAALRYDGGVAAYDGVLSDVRPLEGDPGTRVSGSRAWRSAPAGGARRGVRLSLHYLGESRWRRVWPYHAQVEDVARTIVTVRTRSGGFSFLAADLEHGPILAPEYGFFVRALGPPQAAPAAAAPAIPHTLLQARMASILGNEDLQGWGDPASPWFAANVSERPASVQGITIPPRSVAMHPGADCDTCAGWQSPIDGRVALHARVAHAHPGGGDGLVWMIVREAANGPEVLARGSIDRGGEHAIGEAGLDDIAVKAGDTLALVLNRRGDHTCDSTVVELTIAERDAPARKWDLTTDVAGSVMAGNPHADGAGRPAVWSFYTVPSGVPATDEPPFDRASRAASAREFQRELTARGLTTVRQRTRAHAEQTWDGAVAALHPAEMLPPHPRPEFPPPMQVSVPDERLTAQWNLGAWHLLRHAVKRDDGTWWFNDFPFGILSSETYMILRSLDLVGLYQEATDGLDQWLSLPLQTQRQPGGWDSGNPALNVQPDRPFGHFSDGLGCLTNAVGPEGWGGHMDAAHAMGPGAIMFTLAEHFALTGDLDWLRKNAPRMQANAEWILRQRKLLGTVLPGGERLWSRGLQPAQVVTPDSMAMHMQFYETEAYYLLAVERMAGMLAQVDPAAGKRMAAEAETYRRDLRTAVERSILMTPVVPVRDGTYRSFIPFAPYVRGFASGAWGWRRCQGHVGALYWDTVQSADPLISPAGLLPPDDPRVQGHLDVLEDRLLLENEKVTVRSPRFEADRDWFAHASWQYQCGLERHANLHLLADDPACFLRSMLNQYAVDIMPGEYTFREHTTGGPPDKVYEEACFLERFRDMLVVEEGDALWLARAAPRAWFEQGRRISVRDAPTHFGAVAFETVSDVEHGSIAAKVELPARSATALLLRLRHPAAAPIKSVEVNGMAWREFDPRREVVRLAGLAGKVTVRAGY
ncbi:MAG: hypothetical protein HYU66_03455 [Armatimonadetes bacterium]|nr:hypothetical protein [Armatimonadota bacterium]